MLLGEIEAYNREAAKNEEQFSERTRTIATITYRHVLGRLHGPSRPGLTEILDCHLHNDHDPSNLTGSSPNRNSPATLSCTQKSCAEGYTGALGARCKEL